MAKRYNNDEIEKPRAGFSQFPVRADWLNLFKAVTLLVARSLLFIYGHIRALLSNSRIIATNVENHIVLTFNRSGNLPDHSIKIW